jgi:hypothetical protein
MDHRNLFYKGSHQFDISSSGGNSLQWKCVHCLEHFFLFTMRIGERPPDFPPLPQLNVNIVANFGTGELEGITGSIDHPY